LISKYKTTKRECFKRLLNSNDRMSIDRTKEPNQKVMEGVEIESFFDKRTK